MHALANIVGEPTDGKNVSGAVKGERVLLVKAFADKDFLFDGMKACVVGLKRVNGDWMDSGHVN
jgi:hypothetical protein